MADAKPYSALASGYDVVMEHVDYDGWAEYIHGLLQRHAPGTQTILELGCGTGSLALALEPMGSYRYAATDGTPAMIEVATAKADFEASPVQFAVADFTDFRLEHPVDAVLLLYDGINYLLEESAIDRLMKLASEALRPGGVFIFDLSTPENSIRNAEWFEDEGSADDFSYQRHSRYDEESRTHTTRFDLVVEGRSFTEEHVQRAYSEAEIRPLIEAAGLEVVAVLDAFSEEPAGDRSERIHWVVKRPA